MTADYYCLRCFLRKKYAEGQVTHHIAINGQWRSRFGVHECGEGGEYESLVLDAPIFKRRLVLDDTKVR